MNRICAVCSTIITAVMLTVPVATGSAQSDVRSLKRPDSLLTAEQYQPPETLLSEESELPSFSITCNEDNADVYIDNVYCGTTPFKTHVLSPGFHSVRIEKHHFYPRFFEIELTAHHALKADITLYQTKGYINAQPVPSNALVYIDGELFLTGSHQVPTGSHRIDVKKFGYTSWAETVYVGDQQMVTITPQLEKALFAISDFCISRSTFNPDNRTALGTASFSFLVSAAGSARIEVHAADTDKIVWSHTCKEFTTWNQKITWNSSDSSSITCPDGSYYAVIIPLPHEDNTVQKNASPEPVFFAIDRTLRTPILDYSRGTGSLGSVPSACILPRGLMQASFFAEKQIAAAKSTDEPWSATFCLAGSPLNRFELSGNASVLFEDGESDAEAAAGVKTGYNISNFYFAGSLCARYQNAFIFTIAVPLEYALNDISAAFTPELIYNLKESQTGLRLGAGLRFEIARVTTSIWGTFFAEDIAHFNITDTIAAGCQADISIGTSGSIISLKNEWDIYNDGRIAVHIRAGYKVIL